MKRFSKIFSGIAAIMLGFGIILIAFGFGSARRNWEEVISSQQGFDQMEESFDGIEHINLDILFGYIDLGISEDNKIHFRALNIKEDTIEIEQEGSELEIYMEEGKDSAIRFSTLPYVAIMGWAKKSDEFSAPRYEVLLPKNYSGTLKVSMGTGLVRANGIEARGMEFFIDAGELVVRECSAEKFKAECKIGDCVVDGLFEDIETESHIGIQRISLHNLKEDYSGIISCNIGQMDYFNPLSISEQHIGEGRCQEGFHLYERWKGKTGERNLKIKCDIGQVSVRFANREASAVTDMGTAEFDSLLPGTEYEILLEDILPEDVIEAIIELPDYLPEDVEGPITELPDYFLE